MRWMWAALAFSLVLSIGSIAQGNGEAKGCCGCSCSSGVVSEERCFEATAQSACPTVCTDMPGCVQSFFVNATACTSPQLAETCGEQGVMAPASSSLGLAALAVLLSGVGTLYLRRRRD